VPRTAAGACDCERQEVEVTERTRTRIRWTRDLMVSIAATGLFTYEVVLGGGRASVLTACVTLLLSPLVMRVDESRRNGKSNGTDE